jgi:hypothetical protein
MAVSKKPRKKAAQQEVLTVKPIPDALWYPIDWDKVKTLTDLKFIIKNMGLGCSDNSPNYAELKKYLSNSPLSRNNG